MKFQSSIVNRPSSRHAGIVHHQSSIFCILSSVFCLLLLSGCTESQIKAYADQGTGIIITADQYQDLANQTIRPWADPNILPVETVAKINRIAADSNAKFDQVQQTLLNITTAIQSGDIAAAGPDDRITPILKTARIVNTATAPWNPYALLIDAGLLGVIGILGATAATKSKTAGDTAKSLSEVVVGLERAKRKLNYSAQQTLADAMDSAQEAGTQKAVAAIRKDLKVN